MTSRNITREKLLATRNVSTPRDLGPGIAKLEDMLNHLHLAISSVAPQPTTSAPSIERRHSFSATLPLPIFEPSISTKPTESPLTQALALLQTSRSSIASQSLLTWKPETHALQKNLSLDQKSSLLILQQQTRDVQIKISEGVDRGMRALILVQGILSGFEKAMREKKWQGLGSEDMFMVVEGLLERILGALADVDLVDL